MFAKPGLRTCSRRLDAKKEAIRPCENSRLDLAAALNYTNTFFKKQPNLKAQNQNPNVVLGCLFLRVANSGRKNS